MHAAVRPLLKSCGGPYRARGQATLAQACRPPLGRHRDGNPGGGSATPGLPSSRTSKRSTTARRGWCSSCSYAPLRRPSSRPIWGSCSRRLRRYCGLTPATVSDLRVSKFPRFPGRVPYAHARVGKPELPHHGVSVRVWAAGHASGELPPHARGSKPPEGPSRPSPYGGRSASVASCQGTSGRRPLLHALHHEAANGALPAPACLVACRPQDKMPTRSVRAAKPRLTCEPTSDKTRQATSQTTSRRPCRLLRAGPSVGRPGVASADRQRQATNASSLVTRASRS